MMLYTSCSEYVSRMDLTEEEKKLAVDMFISLKSTTGIDRFKEDINTTDNSVMMSGDYMKEYEMIQSLINTLKGIKNIAEVTIEGIPQKKVFALINGKRGVSIDKAAYEISKKGQIYALWILKLNNVSGKIKQKIKEDMVLRAI